MQVHPLFLYFHRQTIVYLVQFYFILFSLLHTFLIKMPLEKEFLGCYNEAKKKNFNLLFIFLSLSFRGHPGIVWSTIPGLSMSGWPDSQFVP